MKCFNEYVKKSEDAISDNARIFWSFINAMTKSNTMPSCFYQNGNYIDNNVAIANCFADFFESVYSTDGDAIDVTYGYGLCLLDMDITIGDVFKCINNTQINSCPMAFLRFSLRLVIILCREFCG